MGWLYVAGTVAFTVYGQLMIKWRMAMLGSLPDGTAEKMRFLASAFTDPFILSAFLAAFIAALCWMAAMTRFEITYVYPFMSLSFVGVFLLGWALLGEPLGLGKAVMIGMIVGGLVIGGMIERTSVG